jgi:hypothetical protein
MLTAQQVTRIPSRYPLAPSYYHSFGMTDHYIVFIEQCLRVPIMKFVVGLFRKFPIVDRLSYYSEEKVNFIIIKLVLVDYDM